MDISVSPYTFKDPQNRKRITKEVKQNIYKVKIDFLCDMRG